MYQLAALQQTSTAKLPGFFQKFLKTVLALRVNETKLISRNASMINLFKLESKEELKNDERNLFSDSPRSFDPTLNTQPTNDAYQCFSGLLQCQPCFGNFLLLLEKRTKFIKLCTKFHVKQANFLPFKCTSLLLHRKPIQQNRLHFFKNFRNSACSKS